MLGWGVLQPAHAQGDNQGDQQAGSQATDRQAFRVCADPHNLPFSDRQGEGFENKIAELMAEDLGLPVEYTWYPQQMGFGRNTLTARNEKEHRYKCDIVMGTTSLDVGQTTKPYYASTYVLIYAEDNPAMKGVQSLSDLAARLRKQQQDLRIGAFTGTPGGTWMSQHHMLDAVVSYKRQSGSRDVTPGRIVKDVASNKLDAAIVWGPIGGYYAMNIQSPRLKVIKLDSQPGLPFKYAIAMGVRYGDDAWKQTVEQLVDQHADGIHKILDHYNIPLVKISDAIVPAGGDDDD